MIRRFLIPGVALIALLSACADPGTESSPAPPGAPAPPAADEEIGELTGPPRLESLGSFDRPVFVLSPPDDPRVFVVEQPGRVVELVDGGAKEPPFIDITDRVGCCGERGLLSMAFAPDYADSGLAYLSYTNRAGDTRIDEYRVDENDSERLNPRSRRLVLAVEQPFANHNGGLIAFDPGGMLVIGLGDGGSGGDPGNRAQNLTSLLGKLLRIDPGRPSDDRPYGIPEDNPFVDRSGARPEIWAYGLRNPWRFSWDEQSGDFYLADVGQNRVEEVNFVPPPAQAGANYGWRKYEGDEVFNESDSIDESRLVRPVFTYPNARGDCSVTGGGIYRGSVSQLQGYYLFGDFCGGVVRGFQVENGRAVNAATFEDMATSDLSSFGEDSRGEMYVTSLGGEVFRITAS